MFQYKCKELGIAILDPYTEKKPLYILNKIVNKKQHWDRKILNKRKQNYSVKFNNRQLRFSNVHMKSSNHKK